MQDYIFNSRRQAHRRRRRMLFRLLLLLLLLAAGAALLTNLTGKLTFTGSDGKEEEQQKDLVPLPPVEKTRPVGMKETAPAAASPAPSSLAAGTGKAPAPGQAAAPPAADAGGETVPGDGMAETATTPAEAGAAKRETASPALRWKTHEVSSGESLAIIFQKMELSPALLHAIVNSSKAAGRLAHIKPGQELRFGFDEENELQELVLQRDLISSLQITRRDDGFEARERQRPVELRIASTQGAILSSLFVDGQKAGLSDAQIMELANIFGWDIDFALELREGDRFSVIYEEKWLDGEKIGNGPILAAEFVNQGKTYRAVRYTDSKGETAYYDPEGNAKRRAFIRTPVKFARISSGFTRKRWHPVLKKWRSHKGVDYAAPRGTPVKATGNGKVTFIGRKGGYGKVIFLRHGGRYTTVYGHLSRFAKGLKSGAKVKQGQIIGYVGSTGLATGPHLHYEFRINGVHRNPLTVKLPKSIRLPKKEMARFRQAIQPMVAQLDELRARSMVASAATP